MRDALNFSTCKLYGVGASFMAAAPQKVPDKGLPIGDSHGAAQEYRRLLFKSH